MIELNFCAALDICRSFDDLQFAKNKAEFQSRSGVNSERVFHILDFENENFLLWITCCPRSIWSSFFISNILP
jgi:hypothetical protein